MNVPNGWRVAPIADVTIKPVKSDPATTGRETIRYVDIGLLGGPVSRLDAAPEIPSIDAPSRCRQVIMGGDTLYSTVRPYLRKVAFVGDRLDHQFASTGYSVLRPTRDIHPKFLYLFTLSQAFEDSLFPLQKGVSYPAVLDKEVRSRPIWFPPLPEQRRIVEMVEEQMAHLDAADAALASAERRISGQLASVRHMAWSEGAHVPLTDVAAIQGGIQKQGKRAPVKNIYPFLRVANVTAQGLDLGDVHRVELFEGELERLRLASGDLLVVEGNGSASQIGRAALWDGSIPDCVHQNHLIRVRADSSKMAPAYLELVWNSPALRAQLTDVASSSSGLHTLSVRKLKTLRVPCPPRSDQERLVTQAAAIVDRQQSLRRSLNYQQQRSAILRRAILAAAFSGRLITRAHAMDPLPGAPADD